MEKKALITGAGALYLQFITTEPDVNTAPVYAEETQVSASLDKLKVQLEMGDKKVFLSNILHSDLSAITSATITLDAAYLPGDFAEEAQGMVKIGDSYSMPTHPQKKPFRLAVPITDENNDQLILNFPYCTLSPVEISGETEREDPSEQMAQFNIMAQPLLYTATTDGKKFVYHKLDMAKPANKAKYDAEKLLIKGWYDSQTLDAGRKTAKAGGTQ